MSIGLPADEPPYVDTTEWSAKQNGVINTRILWVPAYYAIRKANETNRALGRKRERVALLMMNALGHTLPELMGAMLEFKHRPDYSRFLARLEEKGLIQSVPIASKRFRRVICLTPKGHREVLGFVEQLRVWVEADGGNGWYNSPPFTRPSRLPNNLLHDLFVQFIALAQELSELALDRHLHGMKNRRPDALLETMNSQGDLIRVAIEYDKSHMSFQRTGHRLAQCARVLQPELNREVFGDPVDPGEPGDGGVDQWLIVCRSPAQVKRYRAFINEGAVSIDETRDGGAPRHYTYPLPRQRYKIVHESNVRIPAFKPGLESVRDKLIDCMPRL